jgi:photosystem II stability/assembly factor-like uncharacterized protein
MNRPYLLTALYVVFIGCLFLFPPASDSSHEQKEKSAIKENREDGPMEFLKFHLGIRTGIGQDKPAYPHNYQLTELRKAQASSSKKFSAARTESVANGVTQFTERGPGNVPGRTRGLIVDPDDATHNTWFAGSASGGIWKTTDGGSTWQWLTSSLPNLATTTLAMASSNHNVIYAGTGEGFGLIDGISGSGIFKTTNKGTNWSFLSSTSTLGDVNRIVVNPSDETMVIAATNSGIYKSTNGGTSWTKTFSGVVQDLCPNPSDFSILYATQYGTGVIKSVDTGTTWALSNKSMAPTGRLEIDVSPVQPNRIVASAEGSLSGGNTDLYVSDDGGASWYLATLSLAGKTVDYLGTQGWYDNTVAFSPYSKDVVYVGGTGVYKITLGSAQTSSAGTYSMTEKNTSSFLSLTNFNATYYGGKLEVGSAVNQDSIEVRFGSGLTQKANRFLVPSGATSGVADASYTYQDYVDVPFQVWDVTKNQQLMVSFRDQNRNGAFDLIASNTTSSDATQQSREYLFIHSTAYSTTQSSSLTVSGGQAVNQMYFIWPVLAASATWTPNALPTSKLQLYYSKVNKYSATVASVADVYAEYDGKNNYNFVHPDQHNIYPIKQNDASATFQLLLANDGGVYLSSISTSPGTTQGEWKKVGNGYNTSQFYGADKMPGGLQYLGGMQDNSTYFSPSGTSTSTSVYLTNTALAGDGFEALWHSLDPNKMIGGSQYNNFSRSLDGGKTWTSAISGFTLSNGSPDESKFPFISKLACSKQAPDVLYTVSSDGVWKSTDFGGTWKLTSISTSMGNKDWLDVEVSRANANIVWAGAGLSSAGSLWVSTNAGKSFTRAKDPTSYTMGTITRLATDPSNANTAYAIFSIAQKPKILKTTDLGQTWNDITGFGTGTSSSTGFPDVAVYCLYVRPDNPNILWAGTEIGIVESLDGGNSWALLSEFPNVAVWDFKGQDKQIVIATHGRGIWTAELQVDQNANFSPAPQILATGTSPQSKFMMKVVLPAGYDSTQVIINSQVVGTLKNLQDTVIIKIGNLTAGSVSSQLASYKGAAPVYSLTSSGTLLKLQSYKDHFYDYFIDNTNFSSSGLTVSNFGTSNSSLQSLHSYNNNTDASATLLAPIIVSSSSSSLIYQDVAIVQPGTAGSAFGQSAFNDYVVVEGTKDGLTWKPIANGYNASANANWTSTYNSSGSGAASLFVNETFDLKNKFAANDTLLIRFRLHANNDGITSWGWAVDNLYIQQQPTAVEPIKEFDVTIYPNPSSGVFKVKYELSGSANVSIHIWDMTGRSVLQRNFGTQSVGSYEEEFDLQQLPEGQYILRASDSQTSKSEKFVLRR